MNNEEIKISRDDRGRAASAQTGKSKIAAEVQNIVTNAGQASDHRSTTGQYARSRRLHRDRDGRYRRRRC